MLDMKLISDAFAKSPGFLMVIFGLGSLAFLYGFAALFGEVVRGFVTIMYLVTYASVLAAIGVNVKDIKKFKEALDELRKEGGQ